MSIDSTVTDAREQHRYEAHDSAGILAGSLEYQETRGLVVLTHTTVDPAYRGHEVGSALAETSLDDIRERGLKAIVLRPLHHQLPATPPEHTDVLYNAPASTTTDSPTRPQTASTTP